MASLPHQWQVGLSASSAARLRLYSAVSYGVLGLVILLTRLRLVLARASRLLSFLMLGHLDGRVFVVFVLCMSFCLFALGHRCDCPTHQIAQPGTHLHSMTIVYALPDRFA